MTFNQGQSLNSICCSQEIMKVKQSKKIGLGKGLPTKDNLLQDAANKKRKTKAETTNLDLEQETFNQGQTSNKMLHTERKES